MSGPRPPSMLDVARHAGVSHQTVSRVINEETTVLPATRQRVLDAIAVLGYRRNRAARVLATRRSGRIGLLSSHLGLYGPSMIAVALQQAAHEAGYELALQGLPALSPAAVHAAVERLLDDSVEALVLSVPDRSAVGLVAMAALPVPVVFLQGSEPGDVWSASIDHAGGAARATEHLLALGHRSVTLLAGPRQWTEAEGRRAGWLRAHEDQGRTPGPVLDGDWSARSGHEAARMVARHGATAVFAANDAMALGLMHGLHQLGVRIPDDVSVVGFDDVPEARYAWPSLTTVAQDFSALGTQALGLAVTALRGEPVPPHALIEPAVVLRDSTAPPRGGSDAVAQGDGAVGAPVTQLPVTT